MAVGQNRRTVFELYQITPDKVKKQKKWFDDQVKSMATKKITPNRVMLEEGMHLTSTLTPGKLFFFYYDPKHKETLPYYDQFPLVIPFAKEKGAFRGLNLHYLDYQMRMALFNELLKVTGNQKLTPSSKIKYSWGIVKNMAKLAPAQACVKMYLDNHVVQPFCEIPHEFWHTAMMLPVQRFVGSSKESIWAEAKRKYKK